MNEDYTKLSSGEYLNMHTGRVFSPADYNDLYSCTIEVNGKVYNYDPDRDTYYHCNHCNEPESFYSKWAWIALVIILAAAAYYIEYRPGLV